MNIKKSDKANAPASFTHIRGERKALAILLASILAGTASALDISGVNHTDNISLANPNSGEYTLTQTGNKGVATWGENGTAGFILGLNETLNILNGSGTTLIRDVKDGSQSQILGAINAEGSLFLSNKAGILFGAGSVIDVGAQFLATTADITPTMFEAWDPATGQFEFTNIAANINAEAGAQIAADGNVVLVARNVNVPAITKADQIALGAFSGSVILKMPTGSKIAFSNWTPGGSVTLKDDVTATGTAFIGGATISQTAGKTLAAPEAILFATGNIMNSESKELQTNVDSLTIAGGNIVRIAEADDLTLKRGNIAVNVLSVDADGNITLGSDITNTKTVELVAGGALKATGKAVNAGGVQIAAGGDVNVGAINAEGAVIVLSGGDITTGAVKVTDGPLAAIISTNNGDITFDSIEVTSSDDTDTTQAMVATFDGSMGVAGTGTIKATGSETADVIADMVGIGGGTVGTSTDAITTDATELELLVGTDAYVQDVGTDTTAPLSLYIDQVGDGTMNVLVDKKDVEVVTVPSGTNIELAGTLNLEATEGDVTLKENLIAKEVTITAAEAITAEEVTATDGNLTLEAGSDTAAGTIIVDRVNAEQGTATLAANGPDATPGTIKSSTTGTPVEVNAWRVSTVGNADIKDVYTGITTIAGITGANVVEYNKKIGDYVIAGEINVTEKVEITTQDGDITANEGANITGTDVTLAAGDADGVDNDGNINVKNVTSTAGNIDIDADGSVTTGALNAENGDVLVTATNGNITFSSVDASGTATLTATEGNVGGDDPYSRVTAMKAVIDADTVSNPGGSLFMTDISELDLTVNTNARIEDDRPATASKPTLTISQLTQKSDGEVSISTQYKDIVVSNDVTVPGKLTIGTERGALTTEDVTASSISLFVDKDLNAGNLTSTKTDVVAMSLWGNVAVQDVASAQNVGLFSTDGSVAFNTITAAKDTSVTTDGTITSTNTVAGKADVTGKGVSLATTGDIDLDTNVDTLTIAKGKKVTINEADDVTLKQTSTIESLDVTAGGNITLGEAITTTGTAKLSANGGIAGDGYTLEATDATLSAGGDIALNTKVNNLTVEKGTNVSVADVDGMNFSQPGTIAGNLMVSTDTGDLTLATDVVAGGNVRVEVNTTWSSVGSLAVNGKKVEAQTGSVEMEAANNVVLNGADVTAKSDVSITAMNITAEDSTIVSTTGNVKLESWNDTTSLILTDTDIKAKNNAGLTAFGSAEVTKGSTIEAGNNAEVYATLGDIKITDSTMNAGYDAAVYASSNATVKNSSLTGDHNVEVDAANGTANVENATLTAGNDAWVMASSSNAIVQGSTLTAGSVASITGAMNATVDGSTLTADKDARVDAMTATVSNSTLTAGEDALVMTYEDATVKGSTMNAGKDVILESMTGSVETGVVNAKGSIDIDASKEVKLSGALTTSDTGKVTIDAGTAIEDTTSNHSAAVTTGNLAMTAGDHIGTANKPIKMNVQSYTATAPNGVFMKKVDNVEPLDGIGIAVNRNFATMLQEMALSQYPLIPTQFTVVDPTGMMYIDRDVTYIPGMEFIRHIRPMASLKWIATEVDDDGNEKRVKKTPFASTYNPERQSASRTHN